MTPKEKEIIEEECLKRVRYNMLCKDARNIEDKCEECRKKLEKIGEQKQ